MSIYYKKLSLIFVLASIIDIAPAQTQEITRIPRSTINYYEDNATIAVLADEISSWMKNAEQNMSNLPYNLKELVHTIQLYGHNFGATKRISGINSFCGPCRILASIVVGYCRIGAPINILAHFLIKICYLFVYKSKEVCRGLINQDKERLHYIIKHSDVTGASLCSLVLSSQGCGPYKGPSWHIHIPDYNNNKLPEISYESFEDFGSFSMPKFGPDFPNHHNSYRVGRRIDSSSAQAQKLSESTHYVSRTYNDNKRVLKILHLTDPHYDPDYVIGSNAICEAPVCCNDKSGRVRKASDRAGMWGDYRNCDAPRHLVENMLQHVRQAHPDLDIIYLTGDAVPHHIWKVNKQTNSKVMRELDEILESYFPDVPIYGSIGNHDSVPRDSFPPPEETTIFAKFGNKWLYDVVGTAWERLAKQPLPHTAKYAGYYSILIRPKFRIISINTNFCYTLNWWVLYKSVDPANLLKWLVEELQKAEQNDELVHIIGHIPPLYVDCFAQWSHQFSRVVSRYSHIIKGQFYGHSHLDEFRIHYDVYDAKKAVGIEYITPNNGPFHNLNPSYRIYYVDGDHPHTTRDILDYDTYVMDLSRANLYDNPKWYKLYSARADLGLPNLQPSSWDQFTKHMDADIQLFRKYYRYQMQDSIVALLKGCDDKCRQKTICAIVEGDVYMPKKCRS